MNYWKKGKEWVWTAEFQKVFEKIKEILISNLNLTHYNTKQKIIVASDASSYIIGAYIVEKFGDRSIKPIAPASRMLFPT